MPKINVKATSEAGLWRAGRQWTMEGTEAVVSQDDFKKLQGEKRLLVTVIDPNQNPEPQAPTGATGSGLGVATGTMAGFDPLNPAATTPSGDAGKNTPPAPTAHMPPDQAAKNAAAPGMTSPGAGEKIPTDEKVAGNQTATSGRNR